METTTDQSCADGAASRAEGANLTVVLEAELERDMAYSERDDVKRAAARLANALKDIFNDVGELPEVRARFESVYRDVSHYAGLDDGTWHCMTDAPKDGTEVELLLRHVNYRYCTTDEDRARWEQVVRSTWIDFNGGGWTWHGMAGSIVGWRPLPSNA